MKDRSTALREQAALLLAAQRIARMGSWRQDLRSGDVTWSEGSCELFGLAPATFDGTFGSLRGLVLPQDRPAFERACALQAGEEAEYRIRRPDGAVRWLHARGAGECDACGVASAQVGIVVDVTEQRLAPQSHERDAWLLHIASEAARLGGWTIELPERKLTWSDQNCLIHDVPPGYQPTLGEGLSYFPPEYREDVIRLVGACERDGTPYDFEAEKYTAKGRRIWVRCCGEAVRDAAGRIVRLQGSIQDISRQKAAEDQIRDLGVRLTATLENITDGFFTLDRQWRFTYVNAAAERVLERGRDELLGGNIWEKFQPAIGTPFQHHYERALAENVTCRFEAFYPQLGKWFEVRVYPNPDGLAVYFGDVTELRRHGEALRESERELRALAESMPQMVWMAAPDGGNIYCNQRWVAYTGLGAQETAGAGWLQAVHPEDRRAVEATWPWEGFTVECRLRRVDGEYRWMIVRATLYRDQAGQVAKWMGTCTDVHDLKRSIEAIRVSEERFRLLARGTQDAIWDWDMRDDRLWWNEGLENLLGPRAEEVQPSVQSWARCIHPDDRKPTLEGVRQAVATGADVWSGTYRFRLGDGTYAWVSGRTHVIRDSAGAPVRMVGSMADITERVALEEQLRQAQRLDSLGRLTGGVAHDFNNLLTVIVGNAELLTEQLSAQPRLAELAGMVVQAADRAAELTRHLLAFARKQPLQPRAVDANELVANMAPLLQRTLGAHVEIVLAPAEGLWRALVDPAQLDSALLNLCVNARDAMPEGGRLTIATANREVPAHEAHQHPGLQPGAYVVLSVSDTGTGIAPEDLRRVFEPFFTTKVQGKGIGLGLAMVYGFAKQSEGHVDISSRPGHGTTVKLFLPRTLDAAAARLAPDAPAARGQEETVLLVEDDRMVLRYAREQLVALGYRVLAAESPARALDIIRGSEPIDLLLTDMVMPGMNGRQLAEHAARLRPQLKVLYTSGYAEGGIVHDGRIDEGVHLLSKPYRREELARRLREVLGQA